MHERQSKPGPTLFPQQINTPEARVIRIDYILCLIVFCFTERAREKGICCHAVLVALLLFGVLRGMRVLRSKGDQLAAA